MMSSIFQEETANNNLAKFRKVHQEYEEIVDRANTAESNLNQLRARNRQSSVEPRYSNTVRSSIFVSFLTSD